MIQHALLIQEKFSKASEVYDELSSLQRHIADDLFTKIEGMPAPKNILDIGMGTGYLLEKLQSCFATTALFGCDFAYGMLNKSKERNVSARLAQADAGALPFGENTFELVVSNVSYQWVSNLATAFGEVKRVLCRNGTFYFTIFSESTLKELREIVQSDTNDTNGTLPTKALIEATLSTLGFCDIGIKTKRRRSYYRNLGELLVWLKQIGANRYWTKQLYRGLSARTLLNTLSKEYKDRFTVGEKVYATFEVLYVEAKNK